MIKSEKTKEERIKNEIKKLNKIYSKIDINKKELAKNLIDRIAFMKITLEDLEKDITKNGTTEKFKQGTQMPYDRKRPNAELYTNMLTVYQKANKQLTDLLPKEETAVATDGFDTFINEREDI